jgi:hypothetical protein
VKINAAADHIYGLHQSLKFDFEPRGNFLHVSPVKAELAGLKGSSHIHVQESEGKIGVYAILAVSPGYVNPQSGGWTSILFDKGQLVLVEHKNVISEAFFPGRVSIVSAAHVLGVIRPREDTSKGTGEASPDSP